MVSLSIDNAVVLEQKQVLERALSTNPKTQKALQKLIRRVILEARKSVVLSTNGKMKNDPRGTAKAVRTTVYKRILGANINIYNSRKAHGSNNYEPPRKLQPGQRGGNRRLRSQRSDQLLHYAGDSRAFVLRFLNSGTHGRVIEFTSDPHRPKVKRGSQGGDIRKYGKTTNTGRRGNIAARNFFGNSSHIAMQHAAGQLSTLIEELIKKEFK
jgi:hypothetical protein